VGGPVEPDNWCLGPVAASSELDPAPGKWFSIGKGATGVGKAGEIVIEVGEFQARGAPDAAECR